ncbi:sulfite exporter TauE/SafE family protein [Novosphingobium sp.]|uniref:sulfite exporter TauE/SafE family protein n=1 Tax=Novosphingobium sp. TaxID=1874826 RepID=UPI0025EB4BBE|nr:sulfite exporter TauE/SafE family protein [Novosphingobium sp.]
MFQHLFDHFDALHAVAGLLVGVLVGLTGVGGGSLMTPLLVLMFGINAKTAVGTDLLYAAVTKMFGSAVHGWRETVDWKIFRRLASGSVPGALIALVILQALGNPPKAAEHVILLVLGVMLVLTAFATAFQKKLIALTAHQDPLYERNALLPTVVLGFVLGVLVSISSVGAGAIGVTVLLMLYPKLPISRIVGTDIVHAVPLLLVAGAGHWFIGDVDGSLLVNLLVGSIPGVIIGSLLSSRAPDKYLRPALAAVLLVSGAKLLGAF